MCLSVPVLRHPRACHLRAISAISAISARKSYVALLMLSGDATFARALELGRRACDAAVFAQCSQWDGTRHVT